MTSHDDVYVFVKAYIGEHGWAPSYREIQEGTGIPSKATVQQHLYRLERDGKLRLGHTGKGGGTRMIALVKQ